jgi:hypothetical protein
MLARRTSAAVRFSAAAGNLQLGLTRITVNRDPRRNSSSNSSDGSVEKSGENSPSVGQNASTNVDLRRREAVPERSWGDWWTDMKRGFMDGTQSYGSGETDTLAADIDSASERFVRFRGFLYGGGPRISEFL